MAFFRQGRRTSPQERIEALLRHLELFDELLGGVTNFATMKKHFKSYISGWDGAKELRIKLMENKDLAEVRETLAHSLRNT